MKCPKCSFISFDYNEICPKCNKDIAIEREKMNLPTFKPNPPSLLGSLVGGSEESEEPIIDDSHVSLAAQQNIDIELEEPAAEEISLGEFDDTYKLDEAPLTDSEGAEDLIETVDLSEETSGPEEVDLFVEEEGIQELSIDLEDFDIEEEAVPAPARPDEGDAEEIVLDMDLPSSQAAQMEETPVLGPSGDDDEVNLVDIEALSKDEPEIILEDEMFADAEEPLDLGEVASAIEDEGEGPDLPLEMDEEGAPSMSEGAYIPHGDTVTLEREFLGLDLELETLSESAETVKPAPEKMSGDELLLEKERPPSEEAAPDETPFFDLAEADDDAAFVDLETGRSEEGEVTLEGEIFEDMEEPLDLGEVASVLDEAPEDMGPSAVPPVEEPPAPEEGALLPHGDTLALDRELLGLDLDLEPSEEDTEISETDTVQALEDAITPEGVDEPLSLADMASAVEGELKKLGPSAVPPVEEPPAPEEGALLPHGDTLALDRELLGLDLELEPLEDDTAAVDARPEQAPEEKTVLRGLDEPLDLEELESPLLEEKPAPLPEGLSPDDTMALDLEALGLDLELEPEEGEETRA